MINQNIRVGDIWQVDQYEAFKSNGTGNNNVKTIWGLLSYEIKDKQKITDCYYAVSLLIVYDDSSDATLGKPDIKKEIITGIYNKKMNVINTIEKPTKNNPMGIVSLTLQSTGELQLKYKENGSANTEPGYVYVTNLKKKEGKIESHKKTNITIKNKITKEGGLILKRRMKWEVDRYTAYRADSGNDNKLVLNNWGYLSYEIKDIRQLDIDDIYAVSLRIYYDNSDDVLKGKPDYKEEITTALYNIKTGVFNTIEQATNADANVVGYSTLKLVGKKTLQVEFMDTEDDVGAGHVYVAKLKYISPDQLMDN